MIISVGFQAKVFMLSFICGAVFSALYDVLRLFRIYKRHTNLLIYIEDILYWCVCAFLFFKILLRVNNGEMRFFIPFGFFCGVIIYFNTIGIIVIKTAQKIINTIIYILKLFIEIILTPFRLLWIVIRKPVKFLINLLYKILILRLKYVKILTVKHSKRIIREKAKKCRLKKQKKSKSRSQVY